MLNAILCTRNRTTKITDCHLVSDSSEIFGKLPYPIGSYKADVLQLAVEVQFIKVLSKLLRLRRIKWAISRIIDLDWGLNTRNVYVPDASAGTKCCPRTRWLCLWSNNKSRSDFSARSGENLTNSADSWHQSLTAFSWVKFFPIRVFA
jgi:hypothetical protein